MYHVSSKDVFNMLADRKDRLSRLRTEWGYDEEILEASSRFRDASIMKYLTGFPPGFLAKVSPLAKDVVDVGVNQIVMATPVVKILLPVGLHRDVEKERKHKRDLERKGSALLWYIDTFSNVSPFRTLVQHALGLGLGWLTYPIKYGAWPDYPLAKRRQPRNPKERSSVHKWSLTRQKLPFAIRPVHPKTVMFDLDHDPMEDVIEEQEVSYSAYYKEYPHLSLPKTGKGILTTYCSEHEYGQWIERKPLLTAAEEANSDGIAPNTTGILWYRQARGGFGDYTYKGDWDYAIKGILRDGRDLILGHITSYNILEVMRQFYGFVPLGVRGETKAEAEAEAPKEFGPGIVWSHSSSVEQHALEMPPIPDVVYRQIEQQDRELGVHFGPYGDALRGIYQAEPASGLRTRLGLAKSPYRQCKQNVEQLLSGFLMDIFYYIKHVLREPLSFPSEDAIITISPEDIPDGCRAIVNWSPPSPEEKALKLQELLQRVSTGSASIRRVLEEDEPVEDVDEELAQILADRVMGSEAVTQLIGGKAVAKLQSMGNTESQGTTLPGLSKNINAESQSVNGTTAGPNNAPPAGYRLPATR